MAEALKIHKREKLKSYQYAELAFEQQGLCGCNCGQPLIFAPYKIRDEHLNPLSNGGTNHISNRSLWRLECTKPKDKKDAKARAKVRSLTKATKKSQKPKQKIQSRKEIQSRPFQNSGKSLQSRGFGNPHYSNVRVDD